MTKQSGFFGLMNNQEQAAQITSLVEDIRDAIMEYQVRCSVAIYIEFITDISRRPRYNRTSKTTPPLSFNSLMNRGNLVRAPQSASVAGIDASFQRISSSLTSFGAPRMQDITLEIGQSA